jgi:hypothetical protein
VGVIRLRTAELIIRIYRERADRTVWQILKLPASADVANHDVQLAIRAKADDAAVMIAALRLACVRLKRSQLDNILVKREVYAVPDKAVDAIA